MARFWRECITSGNVLGAPEGTLPTSVRHRRLCGLQCLLRLAVGCSGLCGGISVGFSKSISDIAKCRRTFAVSFATNFD